MNNVNASPSEIETNEAVERHLDYIQDCCVSRFGRDEIMDILEVGFDVVAMVDATQMLASDTLMACSVVGEAERFANEYHNRTGLSVVVLPCGLQGKITWLVSN